VTDIWTLDGLFGPDSDLVPRLEADGAVTVVAEPAPGISAPAVFLRLVLLGGQDGTRRQIGIQVVEREVAEHGRDLSRAAEGLRLAFHQLHAGMLIMSIDGQILDVNAALCRMVDRSREEILVMDAFALTHPEDRPGDIDLGIRALGGETQGWTRRKRFVRSDGDQVEVIETVTLVRDDEGSPVAFVTQVTDLRELA
jgi:PAS domain S-box-containing protein